MAEYIKVAEDEGEEPIEIPCETDNTVLLTTLTSLFPGASGIKYRNAESGTMRGLRLIDGKIQPPEEGWTQVPLYYCCFPKENKRKIEDSADMTSSKTKRIEEKKKVSDLIVLGLPWKTTDKELKEYFQQFGELIMAQVKKHPKTGESKGFGFIRFADYENQAKVISKRHLIDGRYCDVRVPMSKDGFSNDHRIQEAIQKIFIGRLTEAIQYDDLKEYFSKYGEISDIFIPKPFRGFAFVTFRELDIAQSLCGEDHIIKGISVHVSNAVPKFEMNYHGGAGYNSKPYGRGGGGGGGGYGGYSNSYVTHTHHHGGYHTQSHLDSPPIHTPPGTGSVAGNGAGGPPGSYSSSPYDYYSRSGSTRSNHSYHDAGNPYNNRYSQQQYNSSDYPPYY
uniref:TAR DNA-binding protein 43 n=1 Tax=Dermatophagoides pteronyssinus TaxID=6956 RepID=A0A6P6Y9F5_DERPT|nr:TAR DNA-binding protein 43-like [Dermatophagoides pteronyssinus]